LGGVGLGVVWGGGGGGWGGQTRVAGVVLGFGMGFPRLRWCLVLGWGSRRVSGKGSSILKL
jgi:hypothetical protein